MAGDRMAVRAGLERRLLLGAQRARVRAARAEAAAGRRVARARDVAGEQDPAALDVGCGTGIDESSACV
jgi:hypothetical protein